MQVEPLESNVKRINGGCDKVDGKIVIICIFYLGLVVRTNQGNGLPLLLT
jgi:hypothetical protein